MIHSNQCTDLMALPTPTSTAIIPYPPPGALRLPAALFLRAQGPAAAAAAEAAITAFWSPSTDMELTAEVVRLGGVGTLWLVRHLPCMPGTCPACQTLPPTSFARPAGSLQSQHLTSTPCHLPLRDCRPSGWCSRTPPQSLRPPPARPPLQPLLPLSPLSPLPTAGSPWTWRLLPRR